MYFIALIKTAIVLLVLVVGPLEDHDSLCTPLSPITVLFDMYSTLIYRIFNFIKIY